MKRFFYPFLAGLLLLTFQATLLASLPVHRIRPDVVLILILFLGFSYPTVLGGLIAFSLGFLLDLFSGNALGLYTFTRPLIFFVAQLFRSHFYWKGFSFQFLFVFIFAILEGGLILLLVSGLNPVPFHNLYTSVLADLLFQSIVTGLFTPILFPLFEKGSIFLATQQRVAIKRQG
ncbi:MAG: rod shape-determining protein MreD [Deltaproteobacteria bacterium RBG_13_52_11b]|nr:MAG: rod shape-determining protein MreD [Deltaproteobacteria bacterium RBG_13_52_11b]